MRFSLLNILGSLILTLSILLPGAVEFAHEHDSEIECSETHVGNVDQCHLAIHHRGEVEACEDHSHLIEHPQECTLCDMLVAQIWLFKPQSDLTEDSVFFKDSFDQNYFCSCISGSVKLDEIRGPPSST